MKKLLFPIFLLTLCPNVTMAKKSSANIRPDAVMLMHEMRETPSPENGIVVADRSISFQWPLPEIARVRDSGLDGVESTAKKHIDKNSLRYQVRFWADGTPKEKAFTIETRWPFYNPETPLATGVWHWQYGYVNNGKTEWSHTNSFTVAENPAKFCPPSLKQVLANFPTEHPRVYLDKKDWNRIITSNASHPDRLVYLTKAEKILKTPMRSVNDINATLSKNLDNEVKRNAMQTRESRRIIDSEEENSDILIRAYLLTKDERFARAALTRVKEIITWGDSKNVKGDFNDATFLSLSALCYDAMYDILDDESRTQLLNCIRRYGNNMYAHYNNNLENHIADNHVWQMTLRILTMAAFTTYGELPEAELWTNYCYNVWLARFPGLNKDGAWHNGDSYFHVNIRTLVEVPYFYSRISGFDFFSDPWYQGNAMYVIYQQPPFSKSGGNGSSHQNILKPSGTRVGYADAIARMTGNSYLADYVTRITAKEPEILQQGGSSKAGGLAWFRLICDRPMPTGPGLAALPLGYVFPQSGLASFATNLSNTGRSAMVSFRSSPYGSTSHALANQNAFNTFWSGQPIFYSSGHHISFTDKHSVYCHRASRAHNTILVDGTGQRIGTEGYGWIPRQYVGEKIGYVLGDASNAYGKVISPLWQERGRVSELTYSPENGWDDKGLKTYRRHLVELGKTGLTFVYDELEAEKPVTWTYQLHTVTYPMEVSAGEGNGVKVTGYSKNGVSEAWLMGSGELKTDTTSQFFVPAVNWLRADANGKFKPYDNHWHFSAQTQKKKVYRFATIVSTHAKAKDDQQKFAAPQTLKDGSIKIGSWIIQANLKESGKPSFTIRSTKKGEDIQIRYNGESTVIVENGRESVLSDSLPELEI